jgi:hypothetical protein
MELRIQCAHCKSTGTCTTGGSDGTSCAVCVRKQRLPSKCEGLRYSGVVCSVCSGLGQVEPFTARLQHRIVPLLAIVIVYVALGLVWSRSGKENFHELLAFAGTLIGSVTGFYFGGRLAKVQKNDSHVS